MKTITQYREDVAALMQKIGDMDAKCIAENRDPTDEELTLKTEMMNKVDATRDVIKAAERQEALATELAAPAAPLTVPDGTRIIASPDRAGKDTFLSFDENMMSVMNAARPGGVVDPRLFNISAATGLNETVGSEGAFLIQQDFSNELLEEVFATGVLAAKCRRQPISGTSNSIKINGVDETSRAVTRYGGVKGYWADEADEKTASKPKFRKIELTLKKLIGLCYLTDELMEDVPAIGAFVKDAFIGEFGFLLDDAIYNGIGGGQPLGILNAGSLVSVPKEGGQVARTVMTENIVNMYARRFASMTNNYVWLYNQNIEPQLFTMSLAVGLGGGPVVYMPPGGLSDAPYGRLMGLPAIAIEHAATLGTIGDIVLANLPNGYILAEKGGIKSDISIHVRFVWDEQVFRFILRIDGQPVRATALTPAKGAEQQSHFIALATRA